MYAQSPPTSIDGFLVEYAGIKVVVAEPKRGISLRRRW